MSGQSLPLTANSVDALVLHGRGLTTDTCIRIVASRVTCALCGNSLIATYSHEQCPKCGARSRHHGWRASRLSSRVAASLVAAAERLAGVNPLSIIDKKLSADSKTPVQLH